MGAVSVSGSPTVNAFPDLYLLGAHCQCYFKFRGSLKNALREITNDAFEESDKSYFRVCSEQPCSQGFHDKGFYC